MPHSNKLGLKAEKIAKKYLIKKGYKLLCKNWTCHWGEIDLVFNDSNEIVFVEVKAKTTYSTSFADGFNVLGGDFGCEENFGIGKRRALWRSINIYLMNLPVDVDWRVDLICLETHKSYMKWKLRHYKNVILH